MTRPRNGPRDRRAAFRDGCYFFCAFDSISFSSFSMNAAAPCAGMKLPE
jgi:hypothetical protein